MLPIVSGKWYYWKPCNRPVSIAREMLSLFHQAAIAREKKEEFTIGYAHQPMSVLRSW